MWGSDRPGTSSAVRRPGVSWQLLIFGVVTAVLLGCWGFLKLAPSADEPGPERTATALAPGEFGVITARKIPANQTKAEALAQQQNEEIRLLQLKPLSADIRTVVGPKMSEQDLIALSVQVISLCDDKAQAKDQVIALGVDSLLVKDVIKAACPTS
jgi:hypothetical protein